MRIHHFKVSKSGKSVHGFVTFDSDEHGPHPEKPLMKSTA